jgi:hypothetical protein
LTCAPRYQYDCETSQIDLSQQRLPLPIQKMVVKIRLARFGRTNHPFYNIVVAHARYASLPPADTTSILPSHTPS